MTERPPSYVGISGVVNPEQQSQIEQMADDAGLHNVHRILALGVKAVHKTQFLDIPNKYGPQWYPVGPEQFQQALADRHGLGDSIAVAQTFFDPKFVDNPGYRDLFSDRIMMRGQPWIDAIQFDMLPWHTNPAMIDFLGVLRSKHDTKILLQCHGSAMEALGPEGAVRQLGRYASVIDYVLFDASHGTGKRLDTKNLIRFLNEAYASRPLENVGITVAGGLNGTVVREALPEIVQAFPDISWDAEGQLHPKTSSGTMPLDMNKVQDYLQASSEVLSK
jgi:hypothetical protein